MIKSSIPNGPWRGEYAIVIPLLLPNGGKIGLVLLGGGQGGCLVDSILMLSVLHCLDIPSHLFTANQIQLEHEVVLNLGQRVYSQLKLMFL